MPKISGIPRTAADAREHNSPVAVDFNSLPDQEKKNWITISNTSKTAHGDIGRIGPSPTPGHHIVCYFDQGTQDYTDCHDVPGGSDVA
jgi:hypothetical protein